MQVKKKVCGGSEVDTDQASVGSSSEKMDSTRSALLPNTKIGGNNIHRWSGTYGITTGKNINGVGLHLHRQILRIRDEDSHIGEDINAQLLLNLCVAVNKQQEVASLMLLSRPVLPASPLSVKDY